MPLCYLLPLQWKAGGGRAKLLFGLAATGTGSRGGAVAGDSEQQDEGFREEDFLAEAQRCCLPMIDDALQQCFSRCRD